MCGPQIRLCLFMFRPIASKQLKSLTTIVTLSWLGGSAETHPLWMPELPGSTLSTSKGFYVWFFCFVVVVFLLCCSKKHYLSQTYFFFTISFAMVIYFKYFTLADARLLPAEVLWVKLPSLRSDMYLQKYMLNLHRYFTSEDQKYKYKNTMYLLEQLRMNNTQKKVLLSF